jgi:hypothetical protein
MSLAIAERPASINKIDFPSQPPSSSLEFDNVVELHCAGGGGYLSKRTGGEVIGRDDEELYI